LGVKNDLIMSQNRGALGVKNDPVRVVLGVKNDPVRVVLGVKMTPLDPQNEGPEETVSIYLAIVSYRGYP